MIKFLRNKTNQKRLFLVMALAIVPSFIIWGVSVDKDKGGGQAPGALAGSIGSRKVSTGEFVRNYEALRRELMLFHGEEGRGLADRMDLEESTWERLLLLEAAKSQHIKTSNREVVDWLQLQQAFSPQGRFDAAMYEHFVQSQLGVTPREFEEGIRNFLTIRKILEEFKPKTPFTEADALKTFRERHAPRDLQYAIVPNDPSAPEPQVTPAEVDELYDAMKNVLYRSEAVSLQSVFLPKDSPQDTEENRSAISAGGPSKAADLGLTVKETGFVSRNDPLPDIGFSEKAATAVFSLKKEGDATPWIDAESGKALFWLLKRRPMEPIPVEEAKTEIKQKLIEDKRDGVLREKAAALKKEMAEKGFAEACAAQNVPVYEAKGHKPDDYLEKTGVIENYDKKVGPLKAGEISEPLKVPGGFALIKVASVDNDYIEGWDKEKGAILKELNENAWQTEFDRKMESLRSQLRPNQKTMRALFPNKSSPANTGSK